ncbi:hypothetical protein LXL04_006724 [Taraxacum kok-saghyz]
MYQSDGDRLYPSCNWSLLVYQNDDLCYSLFLVPPRAIPPFWHAIFTIHVNDTMGQMLTVIEYALLLYRAFLPAPVWYRFFLNEEYGSLFSSLTTGLYLTFKHTSIVEKVGSFWTSLKALSRKEVHYGSYATPDQGTCVLYAKKRCKLQFYYVANTFYVNIVFRRTDEFRFSWLNVIVYPFNEGV